MLNVLKLKSPKSEAPEVPESSYVAIFTVEVKLKTREAENTAELIGVSRTCSGLCELTNRSRLGVQEDFCTRQKLNQSVSDKGGIQSCCTGQYATTDAFSEHCNTSPLMLHECKLCPFSCEQGKGNFFFFFSAMHTFKTTAKSGTGACQTSKVRRFNIAKLQTGTGEYWHLSEKNIKKLCGRVVVLGIDLHGMRVYTLHKGR